MRQDLKTEKLTSPLGTHACSVYQLAFSGELNLLTGAGTTVYVKNV